MSLVLRLLGVPVLHADGERMPLRRRKAMALLAYLCVTQAQHHRDSLVALLWPEVDPRSAYPALRNALWTLRQTPLSELIHSDRMTVELVQDERLYVDIEQFRRLLRGCPSESHGSSEVCRACEPRLKEAVGLYQGPFLSGFSAGESVRFDDWHFAEARALHREWADAMDRITDLYMREEDWTAMSEYARAWAHDDSLNELAHRKLMKALAMQGKRTEALQAFDECSRVLATELNLQPDPLTQRVANEIRGERHVHKLPARRIGQRPPIVRTPMIGRQDVARQIENLVVGDSRQIITLVGMGGVGKTRLALHVAENSEARFSDGVVFVSLDINAEGVSVAFATASALGIQLARSGVPVLEQLASYLHNREMLLILDGAERHLPEVAALAQLLGTTPGLRILVTSQVALDTADELVVPVHGLAWPESDTPSNQLGSFAAVQLLESSARRRGAVLQLDDRELQAMGQLARLMSGLPLGLEMAAGWRSIMSWEEIAEQISSNLDSLVHAHAVIAPKYCTLISVFDCSWELLPSDAQATLQALSVFRGGFTLDAAIHVSNCTPSALATLISRWLLRRSLPDRFEMHELLRQFAAGKLTHLPQELERIRLSHGKYYARAISEWFARLKGPEQKKALAEMKAEISNIRSAFQSAAMRGDAEQLRDACLGLCLYYNRLTCFTEAEGVFESAWKAYTRHDLRDATVEAFLRIASGWFASLGDPDVAIHRAEEGLSLLSDGGCADEIHALANVLYVYTTYDKDGYSEARGGLRNRIDACLEFYRETGDMWGETVALGIAASLELASDKERADQLAQERLVLCRRIGDAHGEGLALHQLARVAELRGNLDNAMVWYRQVQKLFQPTLRQSFGAINTLLAQVRVEHQLGRTIESIQLAHEAVELSRAAGYQSLVAQSLIWLARVVRGDGDIELARSSLEEAFSLLGSSQWAGLRSSCVTELLDIELRAKQLGAADRWFREATMLGKETIDLSSLSERLEALRASRSQEIVHRSE